MRGCFGTAPEVAFSVYKLVNTSKEVFAAGIAQTGLLGVQAGNNENQKNSLRKIGS